MAETSCVLGIAGAIASGKSVVARYFEQKGFIRLSYRALLTDILRERGLSANRLNLQDIGLELGNELGYAELTRRLLDRPRHPCQPVVVDGVRHIPAVRYLRMRYSSAFVLLFKEADPGTRLVNFIERDGRQWQDEAQAREAFMRINSHPVEADCTRLRAVADVVIPHFEHIVDLYAFLETLSDRHGSIAPSVDAKE